MNRDFFIFFMKSIRIAIQAKGKLFAPSADFLRARGIEIAAAPSRQYLIQCGNGVEILLLRDDDIPYFVESGAADFGIVGENVFFERTAAVSIFQRLGFGACRLVLAAPRKSGIRGLSDLKDTRIATSYPKILRRFLEQKKIRATIVKVSGSAEIAPQSGIADIVCDLTQTGATLLANGLEEVATVMESQAVLIGSATRSEIGTPIIQQIVTSERI